MKWATIEPDTMEHRTVWNLITLYVGDDGKESTEVTSYATKDQALDAKKAFQEGKFRPSNSSPHPDLGESYKITKKTRGDVGILKKRK
jgi:hypothetical protein|tara:strand:- start:323 stop:586 length:264 start_codon:yes stop_codon:yes gene_type:complete